MSEQSTALPCSQTRFALCFVLPGAMPSHCTFPDCFNHRALGIRPRSRLWLAHVTGYPMPNHRRTALDSPKAKTPRRCSAVLALGESSSKAIECVKRLAYCRARPHSTHSGFQRIHRPVATPDAAIIHRFFVPCNVDRTCRAFFLATETPCRVASIRPTGSQPHGSRPADGPALQPIPLWQCRLVWSFFASVKFSWVYNRAVKSDWFVGTLKIVVAMLVNPA